MAAYSKTTWTNSSAPAINADNLNKIENGIEACSKATVYSTTETVVGTWINNKPIYRKVISVGNMPNTGTTKGVDTGASNIDYVTRIYGIAQAPASNYPSIPLPDTYPADNNNVYAIRIYYDKSANQVKIQTATDRSSYIGYIILEYTKTTD